MTADGKVILLEIKCPFKGCLYVAKSDKFPNIPVYYRSQIQYGMWLLGVQHCDFYVWTKSCSRLERYNRDDVYIAWMLTQINKFYFESYLPCMVAKKFGYLPAGSVDVHQVCEVETVDPDTDIF